LALWNCARRVTVTKRSGKSTGLTAAGQPPPEVLQLKKPVRAPLPAHLIRERIVIQAPSSTRLSDLADTSGQWHKP